MVCTARTYRHPGDAWFSTAKTSPVLTSHSPATVHGCAAWVRRSRHLTDVGQEQAAADGEIGRCDCRRHRVSDEPPVPPSRARALAAGFLPVGTSSLSAGASPAVRCAGSATPACLMVFAGFVEPAPATVVTRSSNVGAQEQACGVAHGLCGARKSRSRSAACAPGGVRGNA